MKKIFLLIMAFFAATAVIAQSPRTFNFAGNGYVSFAKYSILEPDGVDFDNLKYYLMKDGKVVPGIESAGVIDVDEIGHAVYATGSSYEPVYGLKDVNTGEVILEPAYRAILYLGISRYALSSGEPASFVIWDYKNNTKSAPVKGNVLDGINDGMILFDRDGKFGFVDIDNNVNVAPKYDYSCGFSEGLASVCLNGKWGFIDASGKVVIPLQYDDDESWYESSEPDVKFQKGRAVVYKNEKYGVIDKKAGVVVPFKYDFITIDSLKNQIVGTIYGVEPQYDIMDIDGKLLRTQDAEVEDQLRSGLYVKRSSGDWPSLCGVVDADGNEIIPMKYNYITDDGTLIMCQIHDYDNPATPVLDIYDETGKLLYHGVDCMFLLFFVG